MADYGLQVIGTKYGTEKVLFDSRNVGRGTYQLYKGALAFGESLTTKLSDLVMINVTKPAGDCNILVVAKKEVTGQYVDWVFSHSTGQAGGSTNTVDGISGVNYVILRAVEGNSVSGDYGLVCNESAYAGGGVSFDSRRFTSANGEVQLIPSKLYGNISGGHGNNIGYGWLGAEEGGGNDYYSAHGLDWSSVTSYVRAFGLWFTTRTTGKIWSTTVSSGYPNFNNSEVGVIWASSNSVSGGVYLHSHTFTATQGYSNSTFPNALTPPFVGRISLGTYDPQ